MSSSVDDNNNNSTEAMSSVTPGAGAAGALGAINTNNYGNSFKRQKTAAADDCKFNGMLRSLLFINERD